MGLLSIFSKKNSGDLVRLPSGSFTIDPNGRVVASTLPQSFPAARLQQIGDIVLSTFRGAAKANLPLKELAVDFAAFKLTARELRGGAMIFLSTGPISPKIVP